MLATFLIAAICFVNPGRPEDWYCSDEAKCGGVPHTMCEMKALPSNSEYKDIKEATTAEFRKDMLAWHNTYRDKMAIGEFPGWPKAANMRQLHYDDELEKVALRWSFQTRRGHDKCRKTKSWEHVGQNCGMDWNYPVGRPFPNTSDAFAGWVKEIALTDASIVDKFVFQTKYGHFSAIIWANTSAIGCATTTFLPHKADIDDDKGWQGRHTACNLAYQGNWIDRQVYIKGEPCTACPEGTSCKEHSTYPNLCALPDDPVDGAADFPEGKPGYGVTRHADYYFLASMILLISYRFQHFSK